MSQIVYKVKHSYRLGGFPLLTLSLLRRVGMSDKISLNIFRSALTNKRYHKLIWSFELPKEINFWERYFETGGLEWKDRFKERMDASLPLQEDLKKLIEHVESDMINILDVGSGPQTFLGKKLEGKSLVIDAIDPLADTYNLIMEKYNIIPLVKPKPINSEEILKYYEPRSFDLVVARNSLDHAYDPLESISSMIQVVKSGCYVYIITRPNEAINQNYSGLHQWNFFTRDGSLFISSKTKTCNVSEKFMNTVTVSWEEDHENGWLNIMIKKLT